MTEDTELGSALVHEKMTPMEISTEQVQMFYRAPHSIGPASGNEKARYLNFHHVDNVADANLVFSKIIEE